MESCHKYSLPLIVLFLYMSFFFVAKADASIKQRPFNNKVSAGFVFGDSTVDPGNNNYVQTFFRSNFPPYGKDFKDQTPTGRFTNGKLSTDLIVSYIGIKEYLPPYLDPSLSIEELMTGVSFASAGSGFDPLTPQISSVVSIPNQLEYFKEYKKRLQSAVGKKRMEDTIEKAVFLISAGTNDFVVNYFTLPIRRRNYTVSAYQRFILQNVKQLLQDLWDEGARRIAVTGLPPMGCLPVVITLNSENAILERDCIEKYSRVGMEYNQMLQNEVNSMRGRLTHLGAKVYYVDIFTPLVDMIQGLGKLDFDEVSDGCCGSGYLEAGFLCNPGSYVCADASKYVFFDSIHPTVKAYTKLFIVNRPVIDSMIQD
ncbi:GDSL esterase/lipase At5g45960-like [Durio zibethinus]|uniref:GDSL esterase/lipase At5g45960-like n=1 Tax=Durio zibethinus TaxID=66656 RepID=A0A6P5X930_DURZI|nr:GDSL esterase/lipase At5g45960-like [Durio zibethinus]